MGMLVYADMTDAAQRRHKHGSRRADAPSTRGTYCSPLQVMDELNATPPICLNPHRDNKAERFGLISSICALPAAASQTASPPPAPHSALGICRFPPSSWPRASSVLLSWSSGSRRREILSVSAPIWDNVRASPVMSYIPAGSMSAVVWAVGWRRLHHPLPGEGSQAMVRGGLGDSLGPKRYLTI